MKSITTEAYICLKDDMNIEYKIARIKYKLWENEEFEYSFKPNYSVIDLLDSSIFQGIPGLDLDQRKEEYVRKNITPVFISERSPNANRENLWELLQSHNMDYLNQLEWLIRTDTKYIGDRLYVTAYDSSSQDILINANEETKKFTRSRDVIRKLLEYVCAGYTIEYQGLTINNSNRLFCYNFLYNLYKTENKYLREQQQKGILTAKENGKYQGRKPLSVDDTKLYEVVRKYNKKKISADEAAKQLGMSRSTFFRRIKSINND